MNNFSVFGILAFLLAASVTGSCSTSNSQSPSHVDQGVWPTIYNGYQVINEGYLDTLGYYHSLNERRESPWLEIQSGYVDSQGIYYFPIKEQLPKKHGGWSNVQNGYQIVYGGWVDALGFYHEPNEKKGQNQWTIVRAGYMDSQGRFYYPINGRVQASITQAVRPTLQDGFQIVNGGWVDALGFYHAPNEQKGQNPWAAIQTGYVDKQKRFYYPTNGLVQASIRQAVWATSQDGYQIVNSGWVDFLGFYHLPDEQKGQNSWINIQIGYVDGQGRFYYPTNEQVQASIRQTVWPTLQDGYQIVNGGWVDALGFYHLPDEQKGQNSWIAIQIGYVDGQGRFYHLTNEQFQRIIGQGGLTTEQDRNKVVYGGWVDAMGLYHAPNEQKIRNQWTGIQTGYVDSQGRFYYLTNQQAQWLSSKKSNLGYSVPGVNSKANSNADANANVDVKA